MDNISFAPKFKMGGILLALLLTFHLGNSQERRELKPYSLKQAVDFALKHQNAVKIAKLDEYLAQKKVKEFTAVGLPQAKGYLTLTDNVVIPTTVVPASQFDPLAPDDLFIELQFGVQYQIQGGAQITQLLFDGSYIYGVKAAKEYVNLAKMNSDRTRVEIAENVSKAYYSALIASKQFEILQSNLIRVKKMQESMSAMHKEGFIEKLDLDRIKITYQNLLTEQNKVARMVALSHDVLKFQMGLDINVGIVLTDTISAPDAVAPPVNLDEGNGYHSSRIEYQLLHMQESLHLLNSKRIKAGSYPSVAAFGDLGYSWAAPELNYLNDGGFWFPFAVAGLQLNVPIFTGFGGKARLQQSNLEAEKVRLNMNTFEQAVKLEVNNARVSLMNAHNTIKANESTLDLAKEVARVTKIKYKEGVGSNMEVIDAENTLRESETNYLTSLYEYKLAEIDLKKAKGQLLK